MRPKVSSTPVCTPPLNTGVHRCYAGAVAHHTTTFPSGGVPVCGVHSGVRQIAHLHCVREKENKSLQDGARDLPHNSNFVVNG